MARLWLAILVAMAVFLPAFADDEDRGSQGASCPASVLNPRQLCPCNVQPPAGIPRGVDVVSLFLNNLTAATQWDLVKSIKLNVPDIYHPQGLVVVDGKYYFLSTVNTINRAQSQGEGYLMKFGADGTLLGQKMYQKLPAYHPGGIDTDGQTIYMPVAEYHSGDVCGAVPNCTLPGTSYIYLVSYILRCSCHEGHPSRTTRLTTPCSVCSIAPNPTYLLLTIVCCVISQEIFSYNDHVGSATLNGCERQPKRLYSATWGSRRIITFRLPAGNGRSDNKGNDQGNDKGLSYRVVNNPNKLSDYQDCKALWGCSVALCGGVKDYTYQYNTNGVVGPQFRGGVGGDPLPRRFRIGTLGLLDLNSGVTISEVPIVAVNTPEGEILTTNTVAVQLAEDGKTIHFLFAPDDVRGSINLYKPRV
eukprot:jgi/Chrzof1/12797/Cz07g07270.t1